MTKNNSLLHADENQKQVGMPEFIWYLVAVFFYTNMTGMVGAFRNAYLVNVLRVTSDQASFYNAFLTIVPVFFNLAITMFIDGRRVGKGGKFVPLIALSAVPVAVLLPLNFWTPSGLTGNLMMIYILTMGLSWSIANCFGGTINSLAVAMSTNLAERDNVMSLRGFVSAVGNSAPQVIIIVVAVFAKTEGAQYIASAVLCSVVGVITMLFGMRIVKERVVYSPSKTNPAIGFRDVIVNKYAWVIIISEFLKSFRAIANYMGVFLAAALLGATNKFLLFGLPTGIGTAVGMLIINFLLKKFNSKVLYIASGIYSVIANTIAFSIGYLYFTRGDSILQILFIVCLFLIGLQFGASNLLPSMFQADVLEDIELKTGKRLDATLPFVVGIGTMISGAIANSLAPKILYGDGSVIQYIQPTDLVPNPVQSTRTKILMLFFYTVFHGLMMFLAGVPYFFYKLTGKTKEDIHNAVLAKREAFDE